MQDSPDIYENELIDAFDVLEAQAPAATRSINASSHHRNTSLRQPTRPNAPEPQKETKLSPLYPTFASSGPGIPLAKTPTPSKPTQQQQQMCLANVTTVDAPLSTPVDQQQEIMTAIELQRKRLQIEREMSVYQARFDHMAHALAGETPHQIQMRKKRDEERLARQEQRHQTVETRLQHRLDRFDEREKRRARLHARHDRASTSPLPRESQREFVPNGGLDSKNG